MIKNITLRVDDDFHYSVKMLATKERKTLQDYMIGVVLEDVNMKGEFQVAPKVEKK